MVRRRQLSIQEMVSVTIRCLREPLAGGLLGFFWCGQIVATLLESLTCYLLLVATLQRNSLRLKNIGLEVDRQRAGPQFDHTGRDRFPIDVVQSNFALVLKMAAERKLV